MGRDHFEPLVEAAIELPSEKSTGLVFAGVCAVAAVLFRSYEIVAGALAAASLGFAVLAFYRPHSLKTLNAVWFRFALFLNKFVSPIIMFVLFACVVVPSGLIMQAFRDPLKRKRVPVVSSYWIERETDRGQSTMRDQF